MNKRGEAVTITVVALAIIAGLIGFFARPVMNKIMPGTLGTDQKIVSTKTVESKPVWMKNPDGSSTLVQTTATTLDNSNEPVKLTFMQKVGNLGMIGIILVTLGVIFPPLGIALALIWNRIVSALKGTAASWQAKHEEITDDAGLIVKSVDSGLSSMDANIKAAQGMADATTDALVKAQYTAISKALMDMKADFLAELSKAQDTSTKLLVSRLKNS